jgi:predicted RNA-binding Zn-ribbon protein involved in translation (DUF1610 family)
MARNGELEFFECRDCDSLIPLVNTVSETTCPGCGSANGQVISSSEVERRLEEGAVFNIDLGALAGVTSSNEDESS